MIPTDKQEFQTAFRYLAKQGVVGFGVYAVLKELSILFADMTLASANLLNDQRQPNDAEAAYHRDIIIETLGNLVDSTRVDLSTIPYADYAGDDGDDETTNEEDE